jgi:hypothetical protein
MGKVAMVLTSVNLSRHARPEEGLARGSEPLRGALRARFDLRCAPWRAVTIGTGAW